MRGWATGVVCCVAGFAWGGPVDVGGVTIPDGDVFRAQVEHEGDSVRATVVIDGREQRLVLSPHTIRGETFGVWTVGADGKRRAAVADEPHTYRGTVEPLGALAAFSVEGDRLEGVLTFADEGEWAIYAIEPLGDGRHVSYNIADLPAGDFRCGADEGMRAARFVAEAARGGEGGVIANFDCTRTILVAFDADFEYYQINGSSVPAVVADIEEIMNATNLIYETQMNLSHLIGEFVIRTNANDPYTTTDAVGRFFQFQDEWNANQTHIVRDTAHFFTGVDLDDNIIGVAYLGVICEFLDFSYGMSQSHYGGSFAERVGLTAHELGHNWNADHCDGDGDCGIMCSFINGCPGGVSAFGQRSLDAILGWAKGHEACLGEGPDCFTCPADLDGDGDADADDFFLYLDAFAAGNQGVCNLDGDGDCDADDFFAYLDLFAQGC